VVRTCAQYFKQYGYPTILRRMGLDGGGDDDETVRGLRSVLLEGDGDAEMVNLGTLMGDDDDDSVEGDGTVYGVQRAGRVPPRALPDFGDDEFAAVTAGRVRYPI